MLGGNDNNPMLPICMDENRRPQYQTNASNQLQLFGSLPGGCTIDAVNYFGIEHLTHMIPPNKRGRETEDILRQQKLISLNYNVCKDEADRFASIPNPHAVTTGLRLSYGDDERNSFVTSASGSMTQGTSMILLLGDNVTAELDSQKEEFDQYIKMQQEHLTKGIRDLTKRHTASFLAAMEKGIGKKLREKDVELETGEPQEQELFERIKQVTMEAQNWHYRAKYNELVVNVLKTNLEQVISQSQGAEQLGKEGFGDSKVVDAAASYVDPNNFLSIPVAGGAKWESPWHDLQSMQGKESVHFVDAVQAPLPMSRVRCANQSVSCMPGYENRRCPGLLVLNCESNYSKKRKRKLYPLPCDMLPAFSYPKQTYGKLRIS